MVMINEWTDRIYQNTPQEHIITNVVSGRKMRIQKFNLPDTGKKRRREVGKRVEQRRETEGRFSLVCM